ncbi:hypothetical protein F4779DRAFT_596171 [Xylariaceae sp. FL0662B]|nr:hypothetical protein F4779DRAFT_596171 [Xylariaceae sp. FL0662B]
MEWTGDDRFVTYKQYKEDTETIAGWLARNALRCGYQIGQPLSSNPSNVSSARPKGKARKLARDKEKSVSAKLSSGPTYTISVSDFGRMAKAIADFTPKVAIPEALDNLFSRAIDARSRFTQWYQMYSHGEEESNQRHAHFTNVLTSAWEILRPFEPVRTARAKKKSPKVQKPEEPIINLINRFSGLNVEDTLDQGLEVETGTSAEQDEKDYKLTDVASVTLVKSEEELEDDFFFAIFEFMLELDEVRSCIRRFWNGYRRGPSELMLPSILTNTAIQLVRRAEHELDLLTERPKKYPSSLYPVWNFPDIFMYITHEEGLIKKNEDLESFIKPSPEYIEIRCAHADLFLSETFNALKHALYEVNDIGKQYILPEDRTDSSTASETFRRIKRMLPCLQGVSNAMAHSPASDEITSGIGVMFETETIPIWVAFGVQLLLDIQDELEAVPQKALREVQKHTRHKLSAIRSKNLDKEPFSQRPEGSQWLAMFLSAHERDVLEDNFRKQISMSGGRDLSGRFVIPNLDDLDDIPGLPEFIKERDYFLRINPVKCGILKYNLYLQTHNHAVNLEGSWRGITCMVHLYVACRSLFPEDPVWPDMEYFLIGNYR